MTEQSQTIQELQVTARIIVPINPAGARSDNGIDGEVNYYISGSTIIMQIYDFSGGAWRAVTLS